MSESSSTPILILNNGPLIDSIKLNMDQIKKAAHVIRSINHKLRRNILSLIEQNKQLTVTDIMIKLRLEQSVVSQHLAILRFHDVVKTKREGKFIYYSINKERLGEIISLIDKLAK